MIGGSLLFVRAPCVRVIALVVTDFVSALPRASARAHYFERYLTVTVKICTLESMFPVLLSGSIVWWYSP